ncbi:MAG TPA: L-idonate 5-dehydrogenase, partial [Nocardioidaceae bacterium]|nr:L-idonate 5-dehydrogenase [Nocardioidaceae bacterium]
HGKRDMRTEEVDTPEPGDGQLRLRIAYAGICGSDLHYYYDGANGAFVVKGPLVPGHEISGTVDLDPTGTFQPGTSVTVHPATFGTPQPGLDERPHLWPQGAYLGSASTWPHTQGGMSEYLLVRPDMVRVLPESLPLRRAALAEPLAVGLHAVNIAGDLAGRRVLVSGAGPIGLLTAAAAVAAGAAEVVSSDVLAGPLDRARALGVHDVIDVASDGVPAEAFDVVLECSGVPVAVSAALNAVRRAGVVVQVGMLPGEPVGINLAPLVSKEAQLRGAFRFSDEIDQAVELLAFRPELERVITHELPAERAEVAFAIAKDSDASGKVVVAL